MLRPDDEQYYEELTEMLTDPTVLIRPVGKSNIGAAAAAAGRALMVDSFESQEALNHFLKTGTTCRGLRQDPGGLPHPKRSATDYG